MKLYYADIIERIQEKPKWWDSRGVPRYCDFNPSVCPNLYADEIVLLRIACQNCKAQFDVQYEWDRLSTELSRPSEQPNTIAYGDPPHNRCCMLGPSMQSISLSTLQFWVRNKKMDWVRRPDLENIELDSLDNYKN